MKKRTLIVLVVVLVCTFLTACSKEIDTVTESVNEKESSVIKNPTVLEDTIEIVFPEQFEGLSGYDEEALVDYLKENSDGNYQKIECIDGQVNMVATQEEIEYWKGYVEKHIDDQKAVLTGINQKYDMCCNDSYNTNQPCVVLSDCSCDALISKGQRRVSIVNNKHSFKVCVSFHQPGLNGIAQTVLGGLIDDIERLKCLHTG